MAARASDNTPLTSPPVGIRTAPAAACGAVAAPSPCQTCSECISGPIVAHDCAGECQAVFGKRIPPSRAEPHRVSSNQQVRKGCCLASSAPLCSCPLRLTNSPSLQPTGGCRIFLWVELTLACHACHKVSLSTASTEQLASTGSFHGCHSEPHEQQEVPSTPHKFSLIPIPSTPHKKHALSCTYPCAPAGTNFVGCRGVGGRYEQYLFVPAGVGRKAKARPSAE